MIDRSKNAWMNRDKLILPPNKGYEPRKDKDGLNIKRRKHIEDIKDELAYRKDEDPFE